MLPTEAIPADAERWAPGDLSRTGARPAPRDRAEARAQAARDAEAAAHAARTREVDAARAAGYDAGRRDGEAAEGARLGSAIRAAEGALAQVEASEARWQASVTENIVALAISVARHVIGREVRTDPALVADLVRRALAEFPIDQPMRVRVNPVDLSLLAAPAAGESDPVAIAPNRDVRWLADARIEPGGCVVEGRERIVDGRVDTALERLYRQLSGTDA